jgi:hypothetical protein
MSLTRRSEIWPRHNPSAARAQPTSRPATGGEEFAMILPHTDREHADRVAEL